MKEASVLVLSPWLVETAVTLPLPISVHSFLPIWESLCSYFPFLYGCVLCLVDQLYLTLCDPMDCSLPGSSLHGDSPGKYTGVDCHALLQGIFPTQGPNPGLPHCKRILDRPSHQGSLSVLNLTKPSQWPCRWDVTLPSYRLRNQESEQWDRLLMTPLLTFGFCIAYLTHFVVLHVESGSVVYHIWS